MRQGLSLSVIPTPDALEWSTGALEMAVLDGEVDGVNVRGGATGPVDREGVMPGLNPARVPRRCISRETSFAS